MPRPGKGGYGQEDPALGRCPFSLRSLGPRSFPIVDMLARDLSLSDPRY